MRAGHSPEKGQFLGELDNLLYHEGVDICEVHEQRQLRDHDGWALVSDEQVSWRLQRSNVSETPWGQGCPVGLGCLVLEELFAEDPSQPGVTEDLSSLGAGNTVLSLGLPFWVPFWSLPSPNSAKCSP